MTREEFDNFTIDDFSSFRENLKQKNVLNKEIDGLKELLMPIEISLSDLNKEIDEELINFNTNSSLTNFDKLRGLKEKQINLSEKVKFLKSEIESKEKELDSLNNIKKEKRRIRFEKANASKIVNKLRFKKEGLKLTKASVNKYKEKLTNISITRKATDIFDKVKDIIPSKEEVKDFIKEDLKKGVVYGTYKKVNEKMPEIRENTRLKIDKSKSAIAKVKKGAINSVISTFNKISIYVDDKKKAVIAKKDRFLNVRKAKSEAKEEYNNKLKNLMEEKRKKLEEYKAEEVKYLNDYNTKVKAAISL